MDKTITAIELLESGEFNKTIEAAAHNIMPYYEYAKPAYYMIGGGGLSKAREIITERVRSACELVDSKCSLPCSVSSGKVVAEFANVEGVWLELRIYLSLAEHEVYGDKYNLPTLLDVDNG